MVCRAQDPLTFVAAGRRGEPFQAVAAIVPRPGEEFVWIAPSGKSHLLRAWLKRPLSHARMKGMRHPADRKPAGNEVTGSPRPSTTRSLCFRLVAALKKCVCEHASWRVSSSRGRPESNKSHFLRSRWITLLLAHGVSRGVHLKAVRAPRLTPWASNSANKTS